MSVRRKKGETAPQAAPAEQSGNRLSGLRPVAHDEDETPSREDRTYGETIFNRTPIPLPKLLRRRKPRR